MYTNRTFRSLMGCRVKPGKDGCCGKHQCRYTRIGIST